MEFRFQEEGQSREDFWGQSFGSVQVCAARIGFRGPIYYN